MSGRGPEERDGIKGRTFGLSFTGDGRIKWQFVIEHMSDYAAKITTFSWVDGSDGPTKHVSRDFIEKRCMLYADHASFLAAIDWWNGWDRPIDLDPRWRVNPAFVDPKAMHP